jgi:Leucine-rich repeat (LRR) protein
VLAAADHATALTLHSSQVEGLVACLVQQLEQQQQQLQEEEAVLVQEGVRQLSLGYDAGAGHIFISSSRHHSDHPTHALPTITSTVSSRSATGAAASHPISTPAAKPRGPYFKQLTVTGPVMEGGVRHLEQLLDLLPGTQHLEEVVLRDGLAESLYGLMRASWTCLSLQAPLWLLRMNADATFIRRTCAGKTTNTVSSSRSSSSSWRSSCHTLAVVREGLDGTYLPFAHLQPLLGSLRQLRTLYLAGVAAAELPQHVASLRQLRGLNMAAIGPCQPQVMAAAAQLTKLRHLGLCASVSPITTMPAAFTDLVHLSSLDLSGQLLTQDALEGVCGMTGLRCLQLTTAAGFSAIPNTITNLVSLKALWMLSVPVSSLPECMTALTALGVLGWGPPKDAAAPLQLDVVWRLKSLFHLHIHDDFLTAVPEAVTQLKSLWVLAVEGRAVAALPSSVSALTQLGVLRLYTPQLRTLPEGITTLTRLVHLDAKGVMLQEQSPAVQAFLAGCKARGSIVTLAASEGE